jgi:hypothetical protein
MTWRSLKPGSHRLMRLEGSERLDERMRTMRLIERVDLEIAMKQRRHHSVDYHPLPYGSRDIGSSYDVWSSGHGSAHNVDNLGPIRPPSFSLSRAPVSQRRD